jgi:hypothetical protein
MIIKDLFLKEDAIEILSSPHPPASQVSILETDEITSFWWDWLQLPE